MTDRHKVILPLVLAAFKGSLLMNYSKFKILRIFAQLKTLLDLKSDFDEDGAATLVSSGTEFKSGNAWGLIFAIFIASIGLNVNSTAVIIGAMLISPLMGPIVGAGFSLGTHDFELLKKSATNLLHAVVISIATSTLFFLISPSGAIKSELLARTQPTIFDVLIAFFGGAAGIVASTRKNRGNAVPGVAIATALMPPLCTVGYSIANLELQYAAGALYLFSINAVFILIATYLFTRILGFKLKVDRNLTRDKIIHRYMTWGSFVFITPSVVMAWYLHKKTQFENNLNDFINTEFNFSTTIIAKKDIIFKLNDSKISIYLFGEDLSDEQKKNIKKSLAKYPSLQNSVLNISTIKKDNFSINELEERFVRRNELSQLLKIEASSKESFNQKKSSEILMELNQKFNSQILNLEVNDDHVKIYWKTKPSKNKISQIELETYKLLMQKKISFTHSLFIK